MEAIQSIEAFQKPAFDSKMPYFKKTAKKYYMEFVDIFIHKTQAEKRRAFFGKDPLVDF